MESNLRFILTVSGCLLSTALLGCAAIKEMGRGFAGVSTQVLEEKRKDTLKKSFDLGYNDCYAKVKDILSQKGKESYIYAQDPKKKMIAIYVSAQDTTPVGIFFTPLEVAPRAAGPLTGFTEETGGSTLIEISSPSIYAKEEIANRIFTGIDTLLKPKVQLQAGGLATNSQSQQEKKTDAKEKVINK